MSDVNTEAAVVESGAQPGVASAAVSLMGRRDLAEIARDLAESWAAVSLLARRALASRRR